jgi:YjbE family integral membrane protein
MFDEINSVRFWFDLLQIIGINILLSGDNAVVIALASRSLPATQRRIAIIGGSGAAVALRIALCLIVASLLQVRYLKLIGGLLLLYIGVKLLVDEESNGEIAARSNMWGAIRTILIADAVMSLDNVVAIAAAAHDSVLLISLGLLISIPLIVFGSQLMLTFLSRFPVLITLGGGLLGWIAGEIIVSDPVVHSFLPFDEHLVARIAKPVLALMVMGAGIALSKRAAARTADS